MKKRKILAAAVSMTMVLSMLPVTALAVEGSTPSVTGLTIGGVAAAPNGPALSVTLSSESTVSFSDSSLTTNEAVHFNVQNGHDSEMNVLYVDQAGTNSATLRATLSSSSGVGQQASISLTSEDGTNWSMSGGGALAGLTFGTLASELGNNAITVPAGGMTSQTTNETSNAAEMHVNQDAQNVYLLMYPESVQDYTVTYNYDGGSYSFILPAGATIPSAFVPEKINADFEGWYTADGTLLAEGTTVTGDTTLQAHYTSTGTSSSFDGQLEEGATVLTINNVPDFNSFADRADEVGANRRVELATDLDLNGAEYTAITGFEGDFDGKNHTISNAIFNKVGDNSGMFATIGAGQIVANLKLENITAQNTTNTGILAGTVSSQVGTGGARPLIQNVQVLSGCNTSNGRNAGGIAGYTFLSDIKYCSVQSAVSGLINAGGIAGISYSSITDCYSTKSPTGFIAKKGGIVGSNLETGYIEHCWYVSSEAYGTQNQGISQNNVAATRATTKQNFIDAEFNETYWNLERGTGSTLNSEAVTYPFEEATV